MYEVEVKARLRDRASIIKKLESFGCTFSEVLHQTDYVFIPEGIPFPPVVGSGTGVLRVRKQNDKYLFTLKIPQSNHQDCIEREMEIPDGEMMIEILELMKWDKMPDVDKKRIKTNFKDMEIVLDVIEHLGEFIEVEKIVTKENPDDRKKTQEELFDFLETLGISKADRVIDGKYDIMLWEKLKEK
ncbi:MAG TPA: class IV adenylate cyclase [Candidatus Paceibacterota bacterium]|jgi:adenylate cyclase class 2|nr:class IV adenylate cyclase [Candidatus Paceibacterota bacterium]